MGRQKIRQKITNNISMRETDNPTATGEGGKKDFLAAALPAFY